MISLLVQLPGTIFGHPWIHRRVLGLDGRSVEIRTLLFTPAPPPVTSPQCHPGRGWTRGAEVPDPVWTGGRKMVPPSPLARLLSVYRPPPPWAPRGRGRYKPEIQTHLIPSDRREGLRSPAEAAAGPARGRGAAVLPPLPPGGPPGRSGNSRCASRCRVMMDRSFIKVSQESMLWLNFSNHVSYDFL